MLASIVAFVLSCGYTDIVVLTPNERCAQPASKAVQFLSLRADLSSPQAGLVNLGDNQSRRIVGMLPAAVFCRQARLPRKFFHRGYHLQAHTLRR